jgi:hypothetical protein
MLARIALIVRRSNVHRNESKELAANLLCSSSLAQPTCSHKFAQVSNSCGYESWAREHQRCIHISSYSSASSPRASTHAGAEGIRFSYFQEDARRIFRDWVRKNTPFTSPPSITNIKTVYLPFWSFTANVTATDVKSGATKLRRHGVSGPTLQVYAGHDIPRAMTEVLKANAALASPFSSDMLEAGPGVSVDVEPFAVYESTAWQVAREAHIYHERDLHSDLLFDKFYFDEVESRRVMVPAHIVEYKYLFETFRVYVNGATGDAFGIQQQPVFGGMPKTMQFIDKDRLVHLLERLPLNREMLTALANLLVLGMRPLAKILFWPPFFVGALLTVGGYVAARSTASIRQQRSAFVEWDATRKAEQRAQAAMTDDWQFRPQGRTRADKREERAHEEYSRPYQHKTSTAGSTKTSYSSTYTPPRYQKLMPVDAEDYYDVLGIYDLGKNAQLKDIQAAFRRELMKYHPDHQQETNYDPTECSERTRLIIKAYGVLRDQGKRSTYDYNYTKKRR